jgi:hypothetical protein
MELGDRTTRGGHRRAPWWARALRLDGAHIASARADAAPYRGKRVVLRGWIKTAGSAGAGLWLRADAGDDILELDNMEGRWHAGVTPWTEAVAQIDVPTNAIDLMFGALQVGSGTAWFDDLAIEVAAIEPPTQIVLAGSVVDATGAPAAGAEVALIAANQDLVQYVQADAMGRFELRTLEGTWGLSAHRAGSVGAFIALAKYPASATELRLALGKDGGVTVRGRLTQKVPPGTYVQIAPYSQYDADIFAVPVADDASFEATLPRGDTYHVAVVGDVASGRFERKGDRVDVTLTVPSRDPAPRAVVDYIAKHGLALAVTEAGNGFDDLAPIGALVGKARIVALGEATHGTREFFQLKHRVLEYLVATQGFRVFAIEANQPECRTINDYVLTGKGTAKAALAGLYFWTWDTEEVLAMIEWMRAWNVEHPQQTVQFAGFDMQTSKVAFESVAAFVKDPALLAPIEVLGEPRARDLVAKLAPAERTALLDGLSALAPALARADADTGRAQDGEPGRLAEALRRGDLRRPDDARAADQEVVARQRPAGLTAPRPLTYCLPS